jgi:hypothetical protein
MIQGFSTAATAAVYEFIADRPDIYEQLAQAVNDNPANSSEAMKGFLAAYLKLVTGTLSDHLARALMNAAFTEVRFNEIRQQLQIENAR